MVSATMRSTCSWKTTTPSVSFSAGMRVGWRNSGSAQPCRALRNGDDHVGLHRTGAEQRDVGDEVLEGLRTELPDELALARGSRSGSSRGCGWCGSAGRSPRRRAPPGTRSSRSMSTCSTSRTWSTAWAIADCIRMPRTSSLSSPSDLDVVLVELAHGEADEARLDRGAVEQAGVGQHDPAGVERDVAGQSVEALDEVEHEVEPGRVHPAGPQLGQVGDGVTDVAGGDVGEGLGHRVDLGRRAVRAPHRRHGSRAGRDSCPSSRRRCTRSPPKYSRMRS